jgi:hypothetical protein
MEHHGPPDSKALGRWSGGGPTPDQVDPRSSGRLAWGLWLLVVLAQGLVIALHLANDALSTRELIAALATWVPFLAFATVGAVILARRPGNRSGWLCWAGCCRSWSCCSPPVDCSRLAGDRSPGLSGWSSACT